MRSLSIWAKRNPWKARFTIVIGHLLLCALAFYIGTTLNDLNIRLPQLLLFITLLTFLIAAVTYPNRKNSTIPGRHLFVRRKITDTIVAACSFFMVCYLANNYHREIVSADMPLYGATNSSAPVAGKPTAEEILASLSYRDKSTLTRIEKRVLKKELKHQLKTYIKAKITGNEGNAEKAILSILAVIAALGLIGALGALACSIACNGSEAIAIVLFILGTIGIVIGLVSVINAIHRGKRKTPVEQPATSTGSVEHSPD